MNVKRFETFIIVLIIAIIGVAYALTQTQVQQPAAIQEQQNATTETGSENQDSIQQVPTTTIRYEGVEGRTALDLLKESHRVETEQFSGGEFVKSIDGVELDSTTSFWGFYVNGSQASVGASSYVTKDGDQIEWRVERINQ